MAPELGFEPKRKYFGDISEQPTLSGIWSTILDLNQWSGFCRPLPCLLANRAFGANKRIELLP